MQRRSIIRLGGPGVLVRPHHLVARLPAGLPRRRAHRPAGRRARAAPAARARRLARPPDRAGLQRPRAGPGLRVRDARLRHRRSLPGRPAPGRPRTTWSRWSRRPPPRAYGCCSMGFSTTSAGPSGTSPMWSKRAAPPRTRIRFVPEGNGLRTFEGHDRLVALEPRRAGRDGLRDRRARPLAGPRARRLAPGRRLRGADRLLARRHRPGAREHPDAWFLGEVIHGDYTAYVTDGGLDSVTQYELWKAIWSSLNDANLLRAGLGARPARRAAGRRSRR